MQIPPTSRSEDDPPNYKGLAHLLEHVICTKAFEEHNGNFSFNCETQLFDTVYSFVVDSRAKEATSVIATFSKYLLSQNNLRTLAGDIEEVTEVEEEIVDNEFHEKRDSTIRCVSEILKLKDFHLHKFPFGNRKTLTDGIDRSHLINEFETLRALYRQRPLNVCIYSACELDMVKDYTFSCNRKACSLILHCV